MKTLKKKLTIQEILQSPNFSDVEKKIAVRKWKWNQLPETYRNNTENIKKLYEELDMIEKGKKIVKASPPLVPCPICKSKKFNRLPHGIICAVCHPPIEGETVEWVLIEDS